MNPSSEPVAPQLRLISAENSKSKTETFNGRFFVRASREPVARVKRQAALRRPAMHVVNRSREQHSGLILIEP